MSTVRRVKLSELGRVLQRDLTMVKKAAVMAAEGAANDGAIVARANAPEAFGELRSGIVTSAISNGARIASTAPHSAPVEVGSRPHMPPLEPIIAWVKLRGMQGLEDGASKVAKTIARRIKAESIVYDGQEIKRGPNKGSIRIRRVRGTDLNAPLQVALMIARAIKSRGTKPTWFMRKSVPATVKFLDRYMRAYLGQI